MKTYILFTGIANIVAGGPIYVRNKIKYLEEKNWNVVVFPIDDGQVYIDGLEKYKGLACKFLTDMPGEYTEKQRSYLLNILLKRIPADNEKIIIESGTDYSAYWGELLAEKLHCKHFVFFLDEKNQRVTNKELPFFFFKYTRHELACITPAAMIVLFDGYKEMKPEETYALSFCCTNVIEDYESRITDLIPEGDYRIGYVGRLEKQFVPAIVKGIKDFAQQAVPNKSVSVTFFGGASSKKIENHICEELSQAENIKMYITGYVCPLPLSALKKCDIFVSGAGSALLTAGVGLKTIMINTWSFKPDGFIAQVQPLKYKKIVRGDTIADYLAAALISNEAPEVCKNQEFNSWTSIRECFDEHMEFIAKTNSDYQYYSTIPMGMKRNNYIKKFLRKIFGIKLSNAVIETIIKIRVISKEILENIRR